MPEGAALWTAVVAGDPVKPVRGDDGLPGSGGGAGETPGLLVRVPLVKTAPGDRDYEVVLQYGGKMPRPGAIDKLRFPLVRVLHVAVEQSQVRLHLPETYRYFQFGGTMSRVEKDDLAAAEWTYERKQTERLLDTLRQGDPFARSLAASNLKKIGTDRAYRSRFTAESGEKTREEFSRNAKILDEAESEVKKIEQTPAGAETRDNRARMDELVQRQQAERALNTVQDLGRNFRSPPSPPAGAGAPDASQLNRQWIENNQLGNAEVTGNPLVDFGLPVPAENRRTSEPGKDKEGGKATGREFADLLDKDSRAGETDKVGLSVRAHSPGAFVGAGTANLPSIYGGNVARGSHRGQALSAAAGRAIRPAVGGSRFGFSERGRRGGENHRPSIPHRRFQG